MCMEKNPLKQSKPLTVSCIYYKPITCTMKRFFVVKTKLWNLLKIFLFLPSIKSLFPYPMLRSYSKSSKEPFWLQIGKQTRWIKLTCTRRGGKLNHGPDVHKPRVFRTVKKVRTSSKSQTRCSTIFVWLRSLFFSCFFSFRARSH